LNKVDKLVDVVCYCLNSNHYHMILKQKSNDGIKKFMHKLGTSYTMYFNKKLKRSGSLFQGKFKSIHIDSNEYLLYLSAYVNGITSYTVESVNGSILVIWITLAREMAHFATKNQY